MDRQFFQPWRFFKSTHGLFFIFQFQDQLNRGVHDMVSSEFFLWLFRKFYEHCALAAHFNFKLKNTTVRIFLVSFANGNALTIVKHSPTPHSLTIRPNPLTTLASCTATAHGNNWYKTCFWLLSSLRMQRRTIWLMQHCPWIFHASQLLEQSLLQMTQLINQLSTQYLMTLVNWRDY